MVKYNKLEDETINLIDSDVPSLVKKHFQNMQDLLAKRSIAATDKVKDLLASSKTSSTLIFQELLSKFKSKSLESFDDEHTVKVDNAKFYCDTLV